MDGKIVLKDLHPKVRLALGLALLLVSSASLGQSVISQHASLGDPSLRYTLALPESHQTNSPVPLIVALHYGGPVSPWYGRALLESLIEPALRPLGAVMIAPDCPQAAWAECENALDMIIEEVQQTYLTPNSCIILTGYSKGGIGTWALAARNPARYTAAIVMAAHAPPAEILQNWQLPVRVIHGSKDELFASDGPLKAVATLRNAAVDADIELLDGVSHHDTQHFLAPLSKQVDWLRESCGLSR